MFRLNTQAAFTCRGASQSFASRAYHPSARSSIPTVAAAMGLGGVCAFTYGNWSAISGGYGDSMTPSMNNSQIAFCKPIDTPEYLIPFHLRSIRARFNHYASIRKKGGVRYMTAEDFVCALLASSDTKLKSPHAAADIKKLFQAVDTNHDGKLSLAEFSFLITLLATKPNDLKLAFTMFGESPAAAPPKRRGGSTSAAAIEASSVSVEEFAKVVSTLSGGEATANASNGLVQKLFGVKGQKRCTAEEVNKLIDELRMEVWKAEFRQYDSRNIGAIQAEEFGELVAAHLIGVHLPFYIVENLRKMRANSSSESLVPFSMFVSFSRMLQSADEVGKAIEVYTSSGKALRRDDFNRAVVAVGLPKLADLELDLIFNLFDRDGDGTLEYDEFLSIMKNRINFHVKSSIENKERENFFKQFAKCSAEALF